jgi:tetratricopeptide (TPR) repeat protein
MALRGPCAILNLLYIRGGLVIMTRESSKIGDSRRYEEALAAYEQAIRLDPNDDWNYRYKGYALERSEIKQ